MNNLYILDGNSFNDLEGFYNEMDKLLTKDLPYKTGHNYAAFNDLLRGGFNKHEYGDSIIIRWINFNKSKKMVIHRDHWIKLYTISKILWINPEMPKK